MEISFSKIGAIGLSIISFIKLTDSTLIGQFLRWFPFGWGWLTPVLDIIIHFYAYLGGLFFAIIFLQWTRNVYLLVSIFTFFILFIKFGLRGVSS